MAVACVAGRLNAGSVPNGYVSNFSNVLAYDFSAVDPNQIADPCYYSTGTSGTCSYVTTGASADNGYYGPTAAGATMTSSADANGLHAFASAYLNDFPIGYGFGTSYYEYASATAGEWDNLTISGPAGAAVNLVFTFNLHGSAQNVNDTARVQFNTSPSYGAGRGAGYGAGDWTTASNNATFSTIIPGVPVNVTDALDIGMQLTASAILTDSTSSWRLSSTAAHADFGDTLQFGSIAIEDSTGHILPGYTIQSDSGYNYNQFLGDSSTPEPATFLPVAAGMFAALALRRRGRPYRPR